MKQITKKISILILLAMVIIVCGCTSTNGNHSSPVPTAIPTMSPTITPTPAITATPEPVATPTAHPSTLPNDSIIGSNGPRLFNITYPQGTYSVDWPNKGVINNDPFGIVASYRLVEVIGGDVYGIQVRIHANPGFDINKSALVLESTVNMTTNTYAPPALHVMNVNGDIWCEYQVPEGITRTQITSVVISYNGFALHALPTDDLLLM